METTTPQDRYMEILLEKVREDRYPSSDLMDRIEAVIRSREQAIEYLEVLYEKIGTDKYPSKQMLDRIHRVSVRVS
jgi:hypothetical protein